MSLPVLLKPMREKVVALEASMRSQEQLPLQTNHYFADGMYAREVIQPSGSLVVGKVHKREHFFVVTKGSLKIVMDDDVVVVTAPSIFVSKPGTKRALYALEDSAYMTVHRTKKRNLDKIEQEIVEEDKLALFDSRNQLKALT